MPEEERENSTTRFERTFDASGINRRNLMIATGVGMTSIGGFSQTSAAQNTSGDEIWSFETGDRVSSSPTVVDGMVFVGSWDSNVYAIDSGDGSEIWSFETGDRVHSSPTIVDGTVFVGSYDNKVYALDTGDGSEIWSFETGDSVHSSPTMVDGTVFVGSDDNKVYALDTGDGSEIWSFETASYVRSSPTVVDGMVFVGSRDSNLYALDARDGSEIWAFNAGATFRSSPTVVDGTVFVGNSYSNMYALDAGDGSETWSFETSRFGSSPTVVDGMVFVGSVDDNVYALDAGDGSEIWSFETGDRVHSSPTVVDGTVFVGSSDDNVYALDAGDGSEIWSFKAGWRVSCSPTVVDGTVFVGSDDNNVYALDAGVEGSSEGSRVNLGTLGHHDDWGGDVNLPDEPINETGSITGFVTDSEDTSIADATVKIIDDGDITAETTTDENGEYELTDVDTGTFELEATKVEFEKDTTEIIIQEDTTHNESLELVSKEEDETGSISGIVTDSGDASMADVTIKVIEDDVSIAETNTEENGEYELSDVSTGVFELKAEKSGYETATTEITVESDTTQNTSLELVIAEELEEFRGQKLEIAEHLETISVSDIDEKSEVEALFDEYESLLVDDEVETEQAEEAVERLIMAEEVVTRSLEVTGQSAPRDAEDDDYNMAAQTYASLFQGIVEWKFAIKEIKESLAGLTGYEQIISSALDYLTDAVEDLIVEQTVGFMEDEVDVIEEESLELAEKAIAAYDLADDVTSGDIHAIAEELVDPVAERFGTSGQQNLEEDGSSRLLAESSPGYREQIELSIENTTSEVWEDSTTYQDTLDGATINRNNGIRRINQNAENLENSLTQEHDGLLDLIDLVLDLKRTGLSGTWSVLQELVEFIWDRLPIVRSGFNTGQGIVLIESVVDESYDSVDSIVGRESV